MHSEPELPADAAGPVTATVTRRVKPGHARAYEEFLAGIGGAAKDFPLLENEQFLTFQCGGDTRLVVTKSAIGTADNATKASWRVEDIAGEVAQLRARGVDIQDLPALNTIDGIADIGFALAAWFTDPHQNSIGLLQFK